MANLGPLPTVQNVAKIRLLGTLNAANWANVIHIRYGAISPSPADMLTVATAVRTAWTTNIAPRVSTSVLLSTVEVTDLASRTGGQGVDSVGSVGTRAGTPTANSVAICASLKIQRRFRGGHPRMYLPGAVQADITAGRSWDPTYRSGTETALRAFRTALNAITAGSSTWTWVAVGYYHKVGGANAYKVPPDVDTIQDVVLHTRIDSMRRRTGKEVA